VQVSHRCIKYPTASSPCFCWHLRWSVISLSFPFLRSKRSCRCDAAPRPCVLQGCELLACSRCTPGLARVPRALQGLRQACGCGRGDISDMFLRFYVETLLFPCKVALRVTPRPAPPPVRSRPVPLPATASSQSDTPGAQSQAIVDQGSASGPNWVTRSMFPPARCKSPTAA
jgi:hypothetical protein